MADDDSNAKAPLPTSRNMSGDLAKAERLRLANTDWDSRKSALAERMKDRLTRTEHPTPSGHEEVARKTEPHHLQSEPPQPSRVLLPRLRRPGLRPSQTRQTSWLKGSPQHFNVR